MGVEHGERALGATRRSWKVHQGSKRARGDAPRQLTSRMRSDEKKPMMAKPKP